MKYTNYALQVPIVGYMEKNFARSLTGAGKRGTGVKVRPARPTNCDSQSQCHGERDSENRCPRVPAPSNMLRQRCRWCGGVVGTKELSLLRHTLAEPTSCRFIEDLTGDLLGARARIGTRRHSRHRLCGIIAAWAGGGGEKTLGFWWTRY